MHFQPCSYHDIFFNVACFTALRNIEIASFLRWYVALELHDPAYAKRFYCTNEILKDNMNVSKRHSTFFFCLFSFTL